LRKSVQWDFAWWEWWLRLREWGGRVSDKNGGASGKKGNEKTAQIKNLVSQRNNQFNAVEDDYI
jgi:hypothetical protein